jgi:hypothetical protein
MFEFLSGDKFRYFQSQLLFSRDGSTDDDTPTDEMQNINLIDLEIHEIRGNQLLPDLICRVSRVK